MDYVYFTQNKDSNLFMSEFIYFVIDISLNKAIYWIFYPTFLILKKGKLSYAISMLSVCVYVPPHL